ncbi:hypothetical protein RCH21_002518 [Arthrobacter sp. PL16]|uniref:HIRAN domain-containing protein n=1 Tax=Arthrobacter sp. PL16 TaxID=3071720 RepID=UPI002E00ED6C|nr:hypothetical protein [Arthrobacter sp. PL16]
MGLFSKLTDRVKAELSTAVQSGGQQASVGLLHVDGTDDTAVVGSEYVRKDAERVPLGSTFNVELRREPKNSHDRNAIAVIFKDHKIGYFSAFKAEKYAPLVDIANTTGRIVTASASAQKQHDGKFTNVQMPTVYDFAVSLGDAGKEMAAVNKPAIKASLKLLNKYQDQLERVLAGMPQREIQASMILTETPSGKYKGQRSISFMFQGEEIGVLQAQYREANPEFFGAAESGDTKCMILVRRYEEKIWAGATIY